METKKTERARKKESDTKKHLRAFLFEPIQVIIYSFTMVVYNRKSVLSMKENAKQFVYINKTCFIYLYEHTDPW